MRRHLTLIILAILALLAGACGRAADAPDATRPGPTGTPPSTAPLAERCTNPQDGYSISYPAAWETNPGEVLPTCTVFDEEQVDLVEGTEVPFDITVYLDIVDRPTSQLDLDDPDEDPTTEVIGRNGERIAGRDAVSIRFRSTGEGLLPGGITGHRFLVPLGESTTLIASTYELDERPLADNVATVRGMLQTLSTS